MGPAGPARAERRLAAILAANVGGYSRIIEASVPNPKFATSRVRLEANFGFESTLATI